MRRTDAWVLGLPLVAASLLPACAGRPAAPSAAEPAVVEHVEDADFARVILTPRAAERLGVATTPVGERDRHTVVPYEALIYGIDGTTWVYTSPAPLTFVRQRVEVERIEDGAALLADGPEVGTAVVTTAVAELYGTEFDIGH